MRSGDSLIPDILIIPGCERRDKISASRRSLDKDRGEAFSETLATIPRSTKIMLLGNRVIKRLREQNKQPHNRSCYRSSKNSEGIKQLRHLKMSHKSSSRTTTLETNFRVSSERCIGCEWGFNG